MNFPSLLSAIVALSCAVHAQAELLLPRALKAEERRPAVEILGGGSQLKFAGDPYPLGGYLGIDVGITRDSVGVRDLGKLGSLAAVPEASEQGDVGLWSLTLGKGLYYDVDVFVHFMPFGQGEQVSGFGGGARWLFHEMDRYPIFFSLQGGANSTSFQNLINFSNQSIDLLASYIRGDLSVYLGSGFMRSTGIFHGGAGGVTASGETEIESLSSGRMLGGISYRWDKFYVAGQLDRAFAGNYTVKAGYRF